MSGLTVIAESCPTAWERIREALPFELDRVPLFRAFVLSLANSQRRWYHRDELWEWWSEFAAEHDANPGNRAELAALVEFHSVSVEEGQRWGVQAAFIEFGDYVACWPFVFHVLHPDLNFLTLLTRRHEQLWNNTVGAELAAVADWLAARIRSERLLAVAQRRRKNIGEADLALLDQETGDVFVLELKTVFDKFRTHVQLTNYTEQRVNFTKAITQARTAADAIRDGRWALRELFGKAAPSRPAAVHHGVLTWWDTYNPTLGTGEVIPCCNFATLEYMLAEARGAIGIAVEGIVELAQLYCPGVLTEQGATIDGERLQYRREVQTDALPPPSSFDQLGAGALARSITQDLPQWPDDWATRPRVPDTPPPFEY